MEETQAKPAKARRPLERHPWDRYFYIGYVVAACIVVFIGFGPTYYYRLFSPDAVIPTIVHVHAFIFSLWMLLWLVQTILVEKGRVDLHVKLGIAGIAVALAVIVVGYLTAVSGARTGYLGPNAERNIEFSRMFMAVPMRDVVWFAVCFALAMYFRHKPEIHKRLMLIIFYGSLLLVVGARIPLPFASIVGFGFSLAPPIYDAITQRRVPWLHLSAFFLILITTVLTALISGTEGWKNIADWLTG